MVEGGSSPHTRGALGLGLRVTVGDRSSPHTRGARPGAASRWCSRRDHPRIRGEHLATRRPRMSIPGSSPHTRGAPPGLLSRPRRRRIIPAYAGSTVPYQRRGERDADHPRIRGEHAADRQYLDSYEGSSPHTRGALQVRTVQGGDRRIIPAYAGSTAYKRQSTPSPADHPRIRGEHAAGWFLAGRSAGSSPHTRGAPRPPRRSERTTGIIPAYAGSTENKKATVPANPDHPRIRGEHAAGWFLAGRSAGSSPHTRGAPGRTGSRSEMMRIIPAYAGSTGSAWRSNTPRRDHPRIRGEHTLHSCTTSYGPGSSPHTRGARGGVGAVADPGGIIPAYAGSTTSSFMMEDRAWDHPRIRGEHFVDPFLFVLVVGSSPHTRGAHPLPRPARLGRGIIPAYAGSTPTTRPVAIWNLDHPRIRGEHGGLPFCRVGGAGSSPHTRGALIRGSPRGRSPRIIPAYAGSTSEVT